MIIDGDGTDVPRELTGLGVPRRGSLEATGDLFQPYRLVDGDGVVVAPVAAFFAELAACGRAAATQRSYGMDLLRWFWFLWALGVGWDQATRVEARDFCRWLQVAVKPTRPHWRHPDGDACGPGREPTAPRVNAVTGKAFRGDRYEAATVAHCETVLRGFYDFHLEAGTGPMVNPFPLARSRGAGRVDAHHNPMEPFAGHRSGRYRPKLVSRAPRCIPDERFDQLFAQLGSHRDRALVALWVSTGARASELLGATVADADPGQQLITVIRKGTRALQPLPAAPDAFVCYGCIRCSWPVWCRPGATSRCGGRCGARFGRCVMTRHGRCLTEPTLRWGRTGRCTIFGIPRRIGWLATRRCR